MIKRTRQNKTNEDDTYVVDIDSTANELSIRMKPSRHIDLSGLHNCKQIREIEFRGCQNLESIDLSVLNDSSSLRVIKITGNGTLNHFTGVGTLRSIILPSGCHNLESVIIGGNNFRARRYVTLADCEGSIIPAGSIGITADKHDVIDLSVLNGSPSLRVIDVMENRFLEKIILPSRCPNLEVVILRTNGLRHIPFWKAPQGACAASRNELRSLLTELGAPDTTISAILNAGIATVTDLVATSPDQLVAATGIDRKRVEDLHMLVQKKVNSIELERCPKLRFLDLSLNDGLEVKLPFLRQYSASERPPIIGVQRSEVEIFIRDFESFPKRIKERFVASRKDKMYYQYISLLEEFGI